MSLLGNGIPGLLANGPSANALTNALSALGQKIVVENAWFNQKTVSLDGYHFKHCRFDRCILAVTTTNFALENCFLDESTEAQFGESVIKVVHLFTALYESVMPQNALAQRNEDGTITIGV